MRFALLYWIANRNEDVLDFLTSVVGSDKNKLGLEAHPAIQIHWLDAERYRSDLQAFAADQQRRYNALLDQLAKLGWVAKQDVERFRLKLDIKVIDRRSVKAASIPILGIGDHLN